MKKSAVGPILCLITALCFSMGGICFKGIPWNALSITAARSMISTAVLAVYMIVTKHKFVINPTVLLGAFFLTLEATLFVAANKYTTAANAIVLQFTAPIFIIIISILLFREKPSKSELITCALVFAGIICFFLDELSTDGLIGNIMAIVSGFGYAMLFVLGKFKHGDALSSVIIGHFSGIIIGLPSLVRETDFSLPVLGIAAFLGLFQFGLGYVCFVEGTKRTAPLTAVLITAIEPILNPLLVAIVFREKVGTLSLIGCVIVIASIVMHNCMKAGMFSRHARIN